MKGSLALLHGCNTKEQIPLLCFCSDLKLFCNLMFLERKFSFYSAICYCHFSSSTVTPSAIRAKHFSLFFPPSKITLTVRKFPACHGVTYRLLFMAKLPGM